ncbi:MAG: HlyD family secretion protein, partial [Caulobacterales bacterium]
DSVVISPKIAGYVMGVAVGDNQSVAAGQALVSIDPRPYRAALDSALADLAQRKADLAHALAGREQSKADIEAFAAQVSVANANAIVARKDAQRFDQLVESGIVTAQRRDRAAAERDAAHGTVRAAVANARASRVRLSASEAEIAQARAGLAAAEAAVQSAQADFDGVNITSPIAGVVGDRSVRTGQYVQPGTRLLTVVPLQSLYLVANFKETQMRRMRPGQHARIRVDALDGPKIKGVVDSLAPGTGSQFALLPPENATGNFTKIVQRVPVRIRLLLTPAQAARLRPGLSAEVEVETNSGGRD